MELPNESINYQFENLLTPTGDEWTLVAEVFQEHFLDPARLRDLTPQVMQAKSQVLAEREIKSPSRGEPVGAGFIDDPQHLLTDHRRNGESSTLGRIMALGSHLATQADRVLILGMGEMGLPGQIFFEGLLRNYHNEIPVENRLGVPRIYFEGNHADNDALQELLDLNQFLSIDPEHREERWAVVPIAKSDLPIETAMALRALYRDARDYYGLRSDWVKHLFIPVTGTSGPLKEMFVSEGYEDHEMLTVPDNIGDRFAALTAVGLLPAAIMGLDVRAILQGAVAMTRRFTEEPFDRNPVLQHALVNYLMFEEKKKPLRMMMLWSRKLEALGLWYTQLVSESLSRKGRGPTPFHAQGTRDLRTRGQQLQQGPRDRVITNVVVNSPRHVQIDIQMSDNNADQLNRFARKGLPDVLRAARLGADRSYRDVARATATLSLPNLNEHTMGQLLQMLMLSTVVEAKLLGVNPYSLPGARETQAHMWEELSKTDD